MKKLISISVMTLAVVMVLGIAVSAMAQSEIIGREDYPALCKEGYRTSKETRDIVVGVAEKLKTLRPNASVLLADEIDDAMFWFNKAEAIFNASKAKYDKKQFSKDLAMDFNQAWQWYIKAGSAGVRATMME